MKLKLIAQLCLSTLIGCGGDIGIAKEKTQNDPYDPIEEMPEDSGEYEDQEEVEDIDDPEQAEDFVYRGPYEVFKEDRTANVTNCAGMSFAVYSPAGVVNPPVTVLGHGFARGPETMSGWADHLASWGVEVLLPTLCHYNILAGVDHEMNGQNMIELAQHHTTEEVAYAGHSAGGLAAIIAASLDENSLGVLGLDATDTEGAPGVPDFIGQQYADSVAGTGFSVRGEPSSCNSNSNGLALFDMMNEAYVVKIDQADHCDFENPTDFMCEVSCENTQATVSDEEVRSLIMTFGTSAILTLTGLNSDGWIIWRGQ